MQMELPSYGEIFEEGSRLTIEPMEGTKDLERGFAMMMYLAQNMVLEPHMVLSGLFAKGNGCVQSDAFSRYWLRRYFFLYDEANSTNESEKFETESLKIIPKYQQNLLSFLDNEKRDENYDFRELVEALMWAQVKPGDILQGSDNMDYGSFHLSDDSGHAGVFGMNLLNCLDRGIGTYFHTDFTESAFYHYFRYGDLAMLEIMGDMNAYYPYDLNWSEEKLGKSFMLDDEFVSSVQAMVYYDEYQPLFPFNSRQLIKEKLISLGVEKPKYGLINSKLGYFMIFNFGERGDQSEAGQKFIAEAGPIIKWYLPRAYPLMFIPSDEIAGEEL